MNMNIRSSKKTQIRFCLLWQTLCCAEVRHCCQWFNNALVWQNWESILRTLLLTLCRKH